MIHTLLICFTTAWFITQFEPLQNVFHKLFGVLMLSTDKKYLRTIIDSVYIASGCFKCMSLWITLFVTFNPLYAIILSMLAQMYTKLIINKK